MVWGGESSSAASGGMGPNQISLLLAFGCLGTLVLARDTTVRRPTRIFLWLVLVGLGLLMVLTFARGGVVIFLAGALVYIPLSTQRPREAVLMLTALAASIASVAWLAERQTEGRAAQRYFDHAVGNRSVLLDVGFRMLDDNPLTGVGTGNFYSVAVQIDYFGSEAGTHNELTRAAAEHGWPGLLVWVAFVMAAVREAWRRTGARALAVGVLIAALVSLVYNGSKLLAQPVLIAIALSVGGATARPRFRAATGTQLGGPTRPYGPSERR